MERAELLEEVKQYFSASDHWRRLCCSMLDPDPQGTHIHSYVDTSVHPDSLEALICGYFERLGWPSSRKIDHMSPAPGMGSLHGVEPEGKPHRPSALSPPQRPAPQDEGTLRLLQGLPVQPQVQRRHQPRPGLPRRGQDLLQTHRSRLRKTHRRIPRMGQKTATRSKDR